MKAPKNPTILHLRGSDSFGSPEKLIAGEMSHLDGFFCSCASFKKAGRENDFITAMRGSGFAVFAIEDRGRYDSKIPKRIAEIIRSNGINILVTHEYKSNFYGHLAAKKVGIPQIAHFHGWTREDLKVRLYNFIDRRILRKVSRVIAVSNSTSRLLQRHGVPESRIEVVYNALESERETVPERAKNPVPVMGVIGRLSFEKGVHVFLKALSSIRKKAPPFKAEIYGRGPDEEKLKRMAVRLRLSEIVEFKGHVDDMAAAYEGLDFIVIPSISEGHPLVILEAWERGLGIVASRAGGIPEIIRDGQSGILTDTGNRKSLAKGIRKAIENPDLMNEYGRAGFVQVKEIYNFEKQAAVLSRIYREVAGTRNA